MIRVKRKALIEARVRAGLSQRAMAKRIGKSSGYLSQVERGRKRVSPQAAKDICDVLGVPFDELFEIDPSFSSQATRTA